MNKNKYNKNFYIYLLIFLIILLLIIFYLFDQKNIKVQKYLKNIYSNSKFLHNKFPHIINEKIQPKNINNIIVIDNFLSNDYFMFLNSQFNGKKFKSKDVLLRKASGIDFFNLHNNSEYTGFLELFYSNEILNTLTDTLKKPIQRPPLNDANACSLLIYSNKGDHIDWHLDYSNYNGDRFVVLLTLVNENKTKDGLSENEFQYIYNSGRANAMNESNKTGEKESDKNTYTLKMKPNTLVIFKGSEIKHKSTAIGDGEKRILLSMVFCDICQEKKNIINFIYEKIKNSIVYT